jgi:hypothetical protein
LFTEFAFRVIFHLIPLLEEWGIEFHTTRTSLDYAPQFDIQSWKGGTEPSVSVERHFSSPISYGLELTADCFVLQLRLPPARKLLFLEREKTLQETVEKDFFENDPPKFILSDFSRSFPFSPIVESNSKKAAQTLKIIKI